MILLTKVCVSNTIYWLMQDFLCPLNFCEASRFIPGRHSKQTNKQTNGRMDVSLCKFVCNSLRWRLKIGDCIAWQEWHTRTMVTSKLQSINILQLQGALPIPQYNNTIILCGDWGRCASAACRRQHGGWELNTRPLDHELYPLGHRAIPKSCMLHRNVHLRTIYQDAGFLQPLSNRIKDLIIQPPIPSSWSAICQSINISYCKNTKCKHFSNEMRFRFNF